MTWLETDDGVETDVVIGHCDECLALSGVRDLAITYAMADAVSATQRRIHVHRVAVLHLDAPGLAW